MDTTPNSNTTIAYVLEQDRSIYSAIYDAINAMQNDDNKTIDDFSDDLAPSVGMTSPQLRPMVQRFARLAENDGLCYLSHGRKGGVRKGPRPTETKRSKKKVVEETNIVETTAETMEIADTQ